MPVVGQAMDTEIAHRRSARGRDSCLNVQFVSVPTSVKIVLRRVELLGPGLVQEEWEPKDSHSSIPRAFV